MGGSLAAKGVRFQPAVHSMCDAAVMRLAGIALAFVASGCLTYQAAVKPDEPRTAVMAGFAAAEVGAAALFAIGVQKGDEAKMEEDIDYPVAFGLSLLVVFATDLLIMIVSDAARSASD